MPPAGAGSAGTGTGGGAGAADCGGGPNALSYPQTSQNRPSRAAPQLGHDWGGAGAGGAAVAPRSRNPQTSQYSPVAVA
ncbi:hypothetical protein GCM10009559_74510 [Pseudonocardia zijingensis]|uniref:Uncharacterized protein n=1 Tax=Pseudonocardia zijingensis TaxID=153376 RepID=A0ABN1NGB1_9PSEU